MTRLTDGGEASNWPAETAVRLRLADPVRQQAKRRLLLEVLARPGPIWNPADHPGLDAEGGHAAWVRKLRHEAEQALEKRTRAQ